MPSYALRSTSSHRCVAWIVTWTAQISQQYSIQVCNSSVANSSLHGMAQHCGSDSRLVFKEQKPFACNNLGCSILTCGNIGRTRSEKHPTCTFVSIVTELRRTNTVANIQQLLLRNTAKWHQNQQSLKYGTEVKWSVSIERVLTARRF